MITNIPKHWKIKKLGEIGVFFKGKGVPKNKITDTGFKCLTYGDLYTKYDFVIEGVKSFIDKETALISQEIRYGDICFAGSGETLEDIGKCATFIDDEIGYAGGDIIVFRTEQNPIVMSYLLNSDIAKKQKFSMGQGHSVVHIYSSQLEMLKLPLPPLEEQEKIAEILLTCDKGIRLTTQIITQLKQRNQGLAQQLLTGEKRVKGFEKSVWKEVRLGELLDYEQPTNYLVKNTDYSDEYKIPVLTAGKTFILGYTNEKEGICTNIPLILFDDFTTDSRYIDFPFKVKSSAVKLLKAKKNVNLRFIFEAMKLIKYAIGGHERHWISKYAFLTIFVPSFKEQNAIAQILDTAHQELKLYEQKLQLLQAQKKTLMQKLLTGEVLTVKK
jgi:restriction modification system DNA specificity domain protein